MSAVPFPMRLLRLLQREDGIALIMVVGMLAVLAIATTTAVHYTTANQRSASFSKASSLSYSLAEAGIAEALSKLHNALDPRTGSLLPTTTITLEGGTATYSGTLAGDVWTITSTGKIANPAGVPPSEARRTLVRTVNIYGINAGATVSAWSRIFHDSTASCFTVPVTIPASVGARGDLCLTGSGKITETPRTDTRTRVAVGDDVTLALASSIGVSGTNVEQVDVADTCQYNGGTLRKPCQGPPANADKVYADTVTTTPTDLLKPTVDFAYWYANAKPGPNQNCTTGSFPGGFDNNTIYDNSRGSAEIAGGTSYTCEVRDGSGNLVGELSWNNSTKVLKIKGTIFIDGKVTIMIDSGGLINYQGRGTLYVADQVESDAKVCAGGTGTNNCRTAGMANWDPTTNMLVVVAGDKAVGEGFETGDNDPSDPAFQGVLWVKGGCDLNKSFWMSGPLLCDTIPTMPTTTGFYEWPPLGSLLDGQVYGSTATSSDFLLSVGGQSG